MKILLIVSIVESPTISDSLVLEVSGKDTPLLSSLQIDKSICNIEWLYNYLLDDKGLINIRSKDVDLPLLDRQKVYENYTAAQFITVGLPIVILALFGVLFTYLRKKKYSK